MRVRRPRARLCALALLLTSCGGGEKTAGVAPVPSPPRADVKLSAEAVRLAGIETAAVRSEVVARSLTLSGTLAGNPWTPAERDVISAAEAADARLRLAQAKATRLESLAAQGIVSRQDVDVSRSELDQAQAAAAELQAERSNLGLTGKSFVARPGQIWGLADLPESQLGAVARGARVEARTDALPGRPFAGRIVDVSGASDTQTRGFTIRVAIDDPRRELRSQMLARFAVALPPRTGLALPASAVLLEGDGAYVYVARSATTFHRQAVRVESVTPGQVLVLAGVPAGAIVVTQGAQLLEAERLKESFTPVETD
jgi:Barrel-sandwich domain of CusB or HlyD membrane-fusion